MNKENKVVYLSLLASSAQILESFFPHPLPAARLGLANMISLLAMVRYGFETALTVAILRTVLSALYLGTFMSISFFLSFFSAIVSTFGMYLVYLFSQKTFLKFSLLGISISGAVLHNFTQLCIVYLFFIPQKNIFLFTPLLVFLGLISGSITGWLSLKTVKYFYVEGNEFKKNQNETIEIFDNEEIVIQHWLSKVVIFAALIFVFFTKNIFLQSGMFFLCFLFHLFKKNVKSLFVAIKKIVWLVVFLFLLSIIFVRTGKKFLDFKPITFTIDGLIIGIVYSLRLINIVALSNIVVGLFSKKEMFLLVKKFLGKKMSKIFVLSFYILPDFIDELKKKLRKIASFKDIPKFIAEYL